MNSAKPIPTFGQMLPGVVYQDRPGAYGLLLNKKGELALVQTPIGLFLPGGGLDPGESDVAGLAREFLEEIGHKVIAAELLGHAVQYHWSDFYKSHFKKIGAFYRVETVPPPQPILAKDHTLLWQPPALAASSLAQEFQRWAVSEYA